jgi:hypothetical protein
MRRALHPALAKRAILPHRSGRDGTERVASTPQRP